MTSEPTLQGAPASASDAARACRIFFDTEFLENGHTIRLISIGMVREDGATFYAETLAAERLAESDPWLKENVRPHLRGGACVMGWQALADAVKAFAGPNPEFWAYYADYDWVVLCRLFGRMIDLPAGWPMFCRDVKQEADRLGVSLPKQGAAEHDALADAQWTERSWRLLQAALAPPAVPESVRRLSEAATGGEWYTESEKRDGSYGSGEDSHEGYLAYSIVTDAERPHGSPGVIAETSNSTLGVIHEEWNEDDFTAWDDVAKNNTAFIVAAVNYVRNLLSSTPSPDGPEVSAPPGGGGVVDESEIMPGDLVRNARYEDRDAFPVLGETAYVQAIHDGDYLDFGPNGFGARRRYLRTLFDKVSGAAAPAAPEPAAGGEREIVRHKRRGTEYEVLGEADAQVSTGDHSVYIPCTNVPARLLHDHSKITVYRSIPFGTFYCRFTDEFRDGRFETLSAPAGAQTAGGETLQTIAQWCEDTFGPITPERIATRANEEMVELLAEPSKVEEAADVVIVLSRYPGLWDAIERKMKVNRARRWRFMGDGTGYHVKDAPPPSTATAHDAPEGGQHADR